MGAGDRFHPFQERYGAEAAEFMVAKSRVRASLHPLAHYAMSLIGWN